MSNTHIAEYLNKVRDVYATGVTTEHSFRGALEFLFNGITDGVRCINEPKAVVEVGRPDFVFKRTVGHQQLTVGHCEAKDIDKDISPKSMSDFNKDQYGRYIKGRTLSFDDIRHYQKIIKILSETDRIMKTINLPLDEKP